MNTSAASGPDMQNSKPFPVWNLPLKHPVNLAYEAATADLDDVNMIDPFHLDAYGVTTVNYNRDVEIFPVLSSMLEKIMGTCPYKSPTDMGVNMAGNCIVDDEAVCEASRQEIIRRYYAALCSRRKGNCGDSIIYKLELLMKQAGVVPEDRPVVRPALEKGEGYRRSCGCDGASRRNDPYRPHLGAFGTVLGTSAERAESAGRDRG